MANQREIKNRINSISNTTKITSTMEMVATAKMKKMQQRLDKSKPFDDQIKGVLSRLTSTNLKDLDHPMLRTPVLDNSRVLFILVTGNRGLCGSYNSNIVAHSMAFKDKLKEEGKDVQFYVIGKKGAGLLHFFNEAVYKEVENLEDKFTFDAAAQLGKELQDLFLSGEFHEVYLSYTLAMSGTCQDPEIVKVLPMSRETDTLSEFGDEIEDDNSTGYIFEPNPSQIFSYILPLFVKYQLYISLIESSYSEQFARRVAMKNATDASKDMIKELKITYNRVRQAKITNEIAEIVGGAAALG